MRLQYCSSTGCLVAAMSALRRRLSDAGSAPTSSNEYPSQSPPRFIRRHHIRPEARTGHRALNIIVSSPRICLHRHCVNPEFRLEGWGLENGKFVVPDRLNVSSRWDQRLDYINSLPGLSEFKALQKRTAFKFNKFIAGDAYYCVIVRIKWGIRSVHI